MNVSAGKAQVSCDPARVGLVKMARYAGTTAACNDVLVGLAVLFLGTWDAASRALR